MGDGAVGWVFGGFGDDEEFAGGGPGDVEGGPGEGADELARVRVGGWVRRAMVRGGAWVSRQLELWLVYGESAWPGEGHPRLLMHGRGNRFYESGPGGMAHLA